LRRWGGTAVTNRTNLAKGKRRHSFDPKEFLDTESAGRTIASYGKDQKVFAQGDVADAVFYVQKGRVKLTVVSKQGKEVIIAILGPAEFCGEACLTGQPRRMATAVTMSDCEIMRLEKNAMARVLVDEPAFSEMFIAHLLARTLRVEEDLINSSEKRLARALLLLANFGKEGKPERLIAKVSQETLAGMIGTTRSRVSKFMNKFRKLGFISYNGHLEVHSSLLSVVLNDQPNIGHAYAASESAPRRSRSARRLCPVVACAAESPRREPGAFASTASNWFGASSQAARPPIRSTPTCGPGNLPARSSDGLGLVRAQDASSRARHRSR
jgi:CRP/FNR family cyclic AMP-dependent transcriptional regulator